MQRRRFTSGLIAAGLAPRPLLGQGRFGSVTSSSFDVAVVGAGAFGAWTAWSLTQAGQRVALLDAYGPGNNRASSGGETRILRMAYGPHDLYTRWALRSLVLWKELERASERTLWHATGVLHLARTGDRYEAAGLETLARAGVRAEKLAPSEITYRFPQIATDGIDWALLEPDGGVLLARRGVQTVVDQAARRGAAYMAEATLPPAGRGRASSVKTASGNVIEAGAFVFACGPWLPKVFPELLTGVVEATRAQVFFVNPGPGERRFAPPQMPAWTDNAPDAYGVPDIESRGLKLGIDPDSPPFDPDTGERLVTTEGLAALRRYLAIRFPSLRDAPVVEGRVCQYESTPSGDFLIDRHPDFQNVWLVGGGSGHGFKHGPAVGEYAAARVLDGSDPDPRFRLPALRAATQTTVH